MVGREIVKEALQCDSVSEITLLVTGKIKKWEEQERTDPNFKSKVKYIIKPNFDTFDDIKDQLEGYDAFLCTLGSLEYFTGAEEFLKYNYEYPMSFAKLAKHLKVPYQGLLTSCISRPKQKKHLYMQIRRLVEKDAKDYGLNHLTIFKPGKVLLTDQSNIIGDFLALTNIWLPKISAGLLA